MAITFAVVPVAVMAQAIKPIDQEARDVIAALPTDGNVLEIPVDSGDSARSLMLRLTSAASDMKVQTVKKFDKDAGRIYIARSEALAGTVKTRRPRKSKMHGPAFTPDIQASIIAAQIVKESAAA